MNHGLILDILRCSLHDGPGIRTTVFLKGCPLSCLWCHNPESQSSQPVLSFDSERCTRCGQCVAACPNHNHALTPDAHTHDRPHCTACGRCAAVCPTHALEIKGRTMTVEAVLAEVLKDLPYYQASGGGLTLSGGEPMQQWEFSRDLATAAHSAGIHTALETSGAAPSDRYRALLPHIDLFLFDYKDTPAARHAQLTGISNALILQNLDLLYAAGANIILRCPLIPTINDSDDHLAAIAALEHRYPNLRGIEILPYHRMGAEKSRRIGQPIRLDLPSADQPTIQSWQSRLTALGSHALIN